MKTLLNFILSEPALAKTALALADKKSPALVTGLSSFLKSVFPYAAAQKSGRPLVLITSNEQEAKHAASELESFGAKPLLLPRRDFVFTDIFGFSREFEQERLSVLSELAQAEEDGTPFVLCTSVIALMQRCIPKKNLQDAVFTIRAGDVIEPAELVRKLSVLGFARLDSVEGQGQFSARGGIVDVFPTGARNPVRIEFFGDEIDTVSEFDVITQRRDEPCAAVRLLPCLEVSPELSDGGAAALISALEEFLAGQKKPHEQLSRDLEQLRAGMVPHSSDRFFDLVFDFASPLDYIPDSSLFALLIPNRCRESAESYEKLFFEELDPHLKKGSLDASFARFNLSTDDFFGKMRSATVLFEDDFTLSSYPISPRHIEAVQSKQLPGYGGSLETALSDISYYAKNGFCVIVTAGSEFSAKQLFEHTEQKGLKCQLDLGDFAMPKVGTVLVTTGSVPLGLEMPGIKLAVITDRQLFGQTREKKARPRKSNREQIRSFAEISPGDLIVHESYGIGRFQGLLTRELDGYAVDYIQILYRDGDVLYVPASRLDLISKYIGSSGEDSPIRLSRMGGGDWARVKTRAKESAREFAKKLIALYAERERAEGIAFLGDDVWQTEFEDRFMYTETGDQLRAASEIKADMQRRRPMDRLLCGDVGYGKTEVALRAVMKCVLSGYQAAILVPTTVLARQHYVTAMQRFSGQPVTIEMTSRHITPGKQKKILESIKNGSCDLIVGTHKLLSKAIRFKKLGLLIVDEEQRFGVSHKERLKELTASVDVLTLSATPIPRTLNMALSGIRDLSVIEEPPDGRVPIQTYVMEHDWGVIRDAVTKELSRGGQVYYLHNRVDSIESTASKLRELTNAPVAVAHGKMDAAELEDVMEDFVAAKTSVLVCTTIIETGIDISNVNTLIIEDADKLGLAQLHQIRGRIGRSSRRAYAYLTFRKNKVLTEVAQKRLTAIREFAEFNSGFKIAMRDLEIRGAGNLLGSEQSGHLVKVGYDMYIKMLDEAVLEEKGEGGISQSAPDCRAELSVSAQLPASYVASPAERINLYRRIAEVKTEEQSRDMIDELIDRFGDPPDEAVNLVRISRLRYDAALCGISEIIQSGKRVILGIRDFDYGIIAALSQLPEYKNRLRVEKSAEPRVSLTIEGADTLRQAERFLSRWKGLLAEG
ncbi:MAG: transcription-repair coupling factor [Oscillospiraceae bacterium]|jgi:transcription-repair coupling factor (superfamily II helicase)|nr:transcription-repair coupling factor [Oscillospiraceae bacterium]